MSTRTGRRGTFIALTAASVFCSLALTGCSSNPESGLDGVSISDSDYIALDQDSQVRHIRIDGESITERAVPCPGTQSNLDSQGAVRPIGPASVGTLDAKTGTVSWSQNGRYSNSTEVSITANAVTLGRSDTYYVTTSDRGKAVVDQARGRFEELCPVAK